MSCLVRCDVSLAKRSSTMLSYQTPALCDDQALTKVLTSLCRLQHLQSSVRSQVPYQHVPNVNPRNKSCAVSSFINPVDLYDTSFHLVLYLTLITFLSSCGLWVILSFLPIAFNPFLGLWSNKFKIHQITPSRHELQTAGTVSY